MSALDVRRAHLSAWLLNHPQAPAASELAPDDVIDFVMVRQRPAHIRTVRNELIPAHRLYADAVRATARYLRILSKSGRSHGAVVTAREAWISRGVPKLVATILTRAALARRFQETTK